MEKEMLINLNTCDKLKSAQNIRSLCDEYNIPGMQHLVLYVLELGNGCRYVGKTVNFIKRMHCHFAQKHHGHPVWVAQHKPVSIESVTILPDDVYNEGFTHECAKTIETMTRYGVCKVRGGCFCKRNYNALTVTLKRGGFCVQENKPAPITSKISDKQEARRNNVLKATKELEEYRIIYPLRAS